MNNTNNAPAERTVKTPVYCYVLLITLTLVLCTYFFAMAAKYHTFTLTVPEIEPTLSVSAETAQMAATVSGSSAAPALASQSRIDTSMEAIPFETVYYQDASLKEGEIVVATEGINGQVEVTTKSVVSDGKVVSSEEISRVVLAAPVTQVILTGSSAADAANEADNGQAVPQEAEAEAPVTLAEADVPAAVTENEEEAPQQETLSAPEYEESSAAAQTVAAEEPEYEPESEPEYSYDAESEPEPEYEEPVYEEPVYEEPAPTYSGNTIVTSDGTVLSYSYSMSVTATAYTGGGITATGTPARYGAIAVDPDVIPYGTRLYIETEDGSWVYGVATAEDCGGAIVGNIIDLYFDEYDTCIQFGRRDCTVYILD